MANQDAILNSTATSTMKIMLKSADDKLFMVKEAIAMEFGVLKFFLEDSTDLESTVIPLLNVSGSVLGRVIHYCEKSLILHLILPPSTLLHLFERVAELILDDENDKSIVELVKAADYLDIKVLLTFLMPSFKRRFELGDDKGVEYVYTEDVEARLL
ncbi:SKP1-like protein 14 [Quercus robur]|uniref:SKP1-like protein 14 n=1 Tax=Quercus robur TaxID=38942 RepID=UPI00216319D9|nr:SKP1-like protein 14 [Quercus robur]